MGRSPSEVRAIDVSDDDLVAFDAVGVEPAIPADEVGYVERDGARIYYASYGSGKPVALLHGGLGHGGNWANQLPPLVRDGYRAIAIDSRGHGRSTRDERAFGYRLMADDVVAVLEAVHVRQASLVGWSDGAIVALVLAMTASERLASVFAFGGNADLGGLKNIEPSPILDRCFARHAKDYARLSATPDEFKSFSRAVGLMMRTQPNYSAADLATIGVPVAIVHGERDEFITRDHAEYLARSIPGAGFVLLDGVSHFAPLQRPGRFNAVLLEFLGRPVERRQTPDVV